MPNCEKVFLLQPPGKRKCLLKAKKWLVFIYMASYPHAETGQFPRKGNHRVPMLEANRVTQERAELNTA